MTKFEELQAAHERLLEQSKAPADTDAFVEEVQQAVQQMCVAAEQIPAPRERDQLRAILRFWAAYVYDHTGTYPDTTLHPAVTSAQQTPESMLSQAPHLRSLFWLAVAAFIVVVLSIAILKPVGFAAPATPAASVSIDTSARPMSTAEPIRLSGEVVTSGPSPFDPKAWAVKLRLSATGGNGSYIFWVNGAHLPDASNNQFTVEGKECEAEKPVVGVTSGGQATSIELVVQSPLPECLQP